MTVELIIAGAALMAICALFATLFLVAFRNKKFKKALIFKGCAGACFVIFGALNCFIGNFSLTTLIIFIGLCFGIVGDELIAMCQIYPEYDKHAFICGGVSFAIGHAHYILSLLLIGGVNWVFLCVSFAILVAVSALYARREEFLRGSMKIVLAPYLTEVLFVMALAIGILSEKMTLGAGLFVLGGAFFAVSDNILFAYKFGKNPKFTQNVILHATYYLAQFSIAWSIFFV